MAYFQASCATLLCPSGISHLVSETVSGVSVICSNRLLDELFDGDSWIDAEPEFKLERVSAWIMEHNSHYYAWNGPAFYRSVELDNAVQQAKRLCKTVVIIEALS